MKELEVISYMKGKNLVIPMFLFRFREKLALSFEEFFFLMYLHHDGEKVLFNSPLIAQEFGCNMKKIMEYVSSLQEKKLIQIEVLKNDKNVIEEYISLEPFFDKLTILLKEDINNQNQNNHEEDVYEMLEDAFGRSLNSIEREIVKAWFEHKYTEELIKEAIKEATFSGVANLKYIDRILYEWNKKGFRNRQDVEKNRKERQVKREKVDIFDSDDWLDEE